MVEKQQVKIPPVIVIKELAKLLGVSIGGILARLLKNGITSGMNERIDFETAAIIADDLGFTLELEESSAEDQAKEINLAKLLTEDKSLAQPRPPVVVVMGHVDHGKTKLLDAVRETNVVASEAGGITQQIGAYQAQVKGRLITFIDTPGHKAFTAMRSRGANVADIAILVVACDDGVQPQTKEAMKIIEKANLLRLVALNKVDKPEAKIDQIKSQLAELGWQPEDWGGQIICVPISAKQRQGIDELLEMVLLLTDMNKDRIKANPDRRAVGSVVDVKIDPREGQLATVLVQAGTLKVGDFVVVGKAFGKIRALRDFRGREVNQAGPSTPVRIMGLKGIPEVGDILEATLETRDLKREMKKKQYRGQVTLASILPPAKPKLEEDQSQTDKPEETAKKVLKIVLRGDTVGSLEAIINSLQQIEHPKVSCEVMYRSLGNITEKDVTLAESAQAFLYGFNVTATSAAQTVAKSRNQEIKIFHIIYDLIAAVKKELEALLEAEMVEEIIGQVRVLAVFKTDKKGMIIGGKVISGLIKDKCKFRILRLKQIVGKGEVVGLQQAKKKVKEVVSGLDCGLQFSGDPVVQANDLLECYIFLAKKQTLTI